ncbi:sigma-70 family RNA polymerase sigma factor [Herbiconiux sp. CPCC 205716]|uniref:Sigma-70 family RNA polymerase sigma factor n=1 Tax=Herbiconiux gentiana TaxID=2970912 RepID=A0ABT2GIV3_9MICO|nr:sigma-70 family RNA polymerase sigma factor [Herbiconiux gentiana]MCS5716157.1 sigma-70 family RNA polymerase sigma factor [Herbiconiux gentiana]
MSENDSDEVDLWRRAREGDPAAFGEVFDLHKDRVFRHAYRILLDWHDAEDVAGTAFLELWRNRGAVRVVNGSLLPWLLVTVSNVASNSRRATARYRKLLDRLPRTEPVPAVDDEALARLEPFGDELQDAMRDLNPVDRQLATLVILEGFSVLDAAEAVNLSPGSAKTRLSRMKGRLRKRLSVTADSTSAGDFS